MKTAISIAILPIFLSARAAATAESPAQERHTQPPAASVDTNIWAQIIWGQTTNQICLGAKQIDREHFPTEQWDVLLFVLTSGVTNTGKDWMAPPGFQRFYAELYDISGKSIPHSPAYIDQTNKLYKTFSLIPKDRRQFHIGHIWTHPNLPIRYGELDLTNIFRIERGGEYTLVTRGRIMKLNMNDGRAAGDHSLSTIELPPVRLPIHIPDSALPRGSRMKPGGKAN